MSYCQCTVTVGTLVEVSLSYSAIMRTLKEHMSYCQCTVTVGTLVDLFDSQDINGQGEYDRYEASWGQGIFTTETTRDYYSRGRRGVV